MSENEQQVSVAAKSRGEAESFIDQRQAGLQLMKTLKLPRMQEFKYEDLPLVADQPQLTFNKSEAQNVDKGANLVQCGTTTIKLDVPQQLKDAGVIFEDIFDAEAAHPELVTQNLMTRGVEPDENLLTAYHRAYMNAGAFLYIPKGVKVDDPLVIQTIADDTQANPLVSHLLIVAAPDSSVKVVQHLTSQGAVQNSANLMVEIIANRGSQVRFSGLDELGPELTTYFSRRATIDESAKVEWAMAMMNEGHTVGDVDSELLGEGGKADSKLIAITDNDQRCGINNRVTNRGKHTTGLINQRGVVLGSSELIFNGIGQIIHGAHGSNAEQQNRLLMMSPQAHGDANPILLIDENDVDAGHAASVGQVDATQLYYLLSRGIPKPIAERMVIRGFLSAVLTAIPAKSVRDEMVTILERKLQNVN